MNAIGASRQIFEKVLLCPPAKVKVELPGLINVKVKLGDLIRLCL